MKRWLCRPGRSQRFPRVNPRRRRKQRRCLPRQNRCLLHQPCLPAAPLPSTRSSSEPLPSSEQAFPSSSNPWSSSTNYTTAQTSVIAPPAAGGPYGGSAQRTSRLGEGPLIIEPRRFHYGLQLTVRGVWDDNIFLSHTNKSSDYYFAIEPQITIGFGDIEGRSRSYLRLDYMPSAILFVDHSDQDAFNQLIHLEGGYSTGRLRLTLDARRSATRIGKSQQLHRYDGLWANTDASAPTRMNIFNTRAEGRLRSDRQTVSAGRV